MMRIQLLTLACATLAASSSMALGDFERETVTADGMFNNRASVAIDNDGGIHVAYMTQFSTDDSTKEIMYANNTGGEWVFVQVTDNNVREEFPCLTLDEQGNVHIAFHTGVPNTNKVRYVNNIGTPNGEFNEIIDITGPGYVIAEVRVDSKGTAHFTFRTQTIGIPGEDVMYTTWTASSGVGPLVNISNTPGASAEASQVAVGPDDVVHLVYQAGGPFGGPLVYLNNAGGSFQVQPTGVGGSVQDAMLLISDDNVVSILYRVGDFLFAIDDGGTGTFSAPQQIFFGSFRPSFYERFAIDSQGNRYVAFSSNVGDNRGVYFIAETEDGWQDPVHVDGGASGNQGSSVAIDDKGQVAVAYSISGFDGIVFADLFVATTHIDLQPCTGDLTGDGVVDVSDLLALLAAWGPCPKGPCEADLNEDETVDVSDLLILLGAWGDC